MGSVTVTAKKLLDEAVKRSGRRSTVQLVEGFARVQSRDDTSTGLSRLFAMGEVPLKIYLTLVMLTRKSPHVMYKIVPDHYWAELLGYEELNEADPIPGSGTRRVKRAMAALAAADAAGVRWISREKIRGRGAQIEVTHPPGEHRAPWITIPLELWSHGWINVMSARALYVYLCLRLVLAGKPDDHGVHVSSWDRDRLLIKDDTWQRGIIELKELKLVRCEVARVAVDRWSTDLRKRQVYFLNNSYLKDNESPLEPLLKK
ncbi:hypothetical protein AB0878_45070 [Amycolatopsis sp. NPDC047767]|uniref:hypothetical protein n=1 Tax=Amycolatopsis sp. NPDC047767 TaxID=3156765 RepID=UPI003453CE9E